MVLVVWSKEFCSGCGVQINFDTALEEDVSLLEEENRLVDENLSEDELLSDKDTSDIPEDKNE